jgi:hypothetical protein
MESIVYNGIGGTSKILQSDLFSVAKEASTVGATASMKTSLAKKKKLSPLTK